MKTVVIGSGNVGTIFAHIFDTVAISSRTLAGLPGEADLYIIAVSDKAVKEVAERLPRLSGIVAHTTGSVSMEALSCVNCSGIGVIYPLQTLSKSRPLRPSNIPLLLEASDAETLQKIKKIATVAGFTNIECADSEVRRKIHLSAAFACNFTNAMISISQEILEKCGIDKSIITPLIEETIEKLRSLPAKDAQTGPAARKDFPTISAHLDILSQLGLEQEANIYTEISNYIMRQASSKTP
ncbi:MAG: DUF2520 domain-containing protein [Muribaculaceae bacterium]|nr:DUF2520 domain-containing protein [Muribaculaceae bacterium]